MNRADILRKVQRLNVERFELTALAVFHWQSHRNPLYARYLSLLGVEPETINGIAEIPFLPISFYKNYIVKTGIWQSATIFSSSGTTGQIPSLHHVRDIPHYLNNAYRGFTQMYGDPRDWVVLALLPSYLERTGSSLVAMADCFIQSSKYTESGFFLNDFDELHNVLKQCEQNKKKTLLLGVTYALLDFAERFPMQLKHTTVMETGGMKGKRTEMPRSEVHTLLRKAFQIEAIHSEYGMTELFSQAYSKGNGIFFPTDTMRVLAIDITDPLSLVDAGRIGVLNIVDLANIDTCSFISTEDLGRIFPDCSFEVLGRLDAAELRGCNLMI